MRKIIANPVILSYDEEMNTLLEEKLTYNQISFRYTKGKSHVDGNEIHPYHEILYYIDGNATFLSEEFQEDLTCGTLLIIPKECYHQFYVRNQNEYTRLVLNFPDVANTGGLLAATMTEIKIIKNLSSPLANLLNRMCQVICSKKSAKWRSVFMEGAFHMLLAELNLEDVTIISPRLRESDQLISKCIQYIDKNFASNISAEMLATEMNVSVSTLFHCFKKELGISLYKYIIEKRLIYAHKLISENRKPTKIYLECGYNDYPSFYKAYLKMFGHPPSGNKIGK